MLETDPETSPGGVSAEGATETPAFAGSCWWKVAPDAAGLRPMTSRLRGGGLCCGAESIFLRFGGDGTSWNVTLDMEGPATAGGRGGCRPATSGCC